MLLRSWSLRMLQHLLDQIRAISKSDVIYDGLTEFNKENVFEIPGIAEAGWTAEKLLLLNGYCLRRCRPHLVSARTSGDDENMKHRLSQLLKRVRTISLSEDLALKMKKTDQMPVSVMKIRSTWRMSSQPMSGSL